MRNSRPFQFLRQAVAPFRPEIAALAFSCFALVLRVAVSAGMPASALRSYCLVVGLAAIAVTALAKRRLWLDGPRLALLCLALGYLPSVYGRIGGDGVEYFVQARSMVLDRDLDFSNDYRHLGAAPVYTAKGEVTSRMPIGVALTWIPALALTHVGVTLVSWIGVDVVPDGASRVYQTAATTATFLYGFLALLFLESALRKQYGRSLALLVTVGIWLATPLHFYMVANPFMSHAASALAATLFVVSWLKARESESLRPWIFTGMWGGLMMLVRMQDALLFLIPLVDLVLSGNPRLVRRAGALLVGPFACGLAQASIWMSFYGIGFIPIVLSHGRLAGSSPEVIGLLLSPRHGLLTWTPIFVASLVGWVLLFRRSKRIALGIWLAFASAVFLNSSNADWWGSDSFGQRRMLGMLPLFAWGVAETMEFLKRRPLVLMGAIVLAASIWNLQLGYIYNSMMLGTRNDALTLDRVTEAQVDLGYRRLLAWHRWMPAAIWVVLYDNLKGVWLEGDARSFKGLIDLGQEPPGFFPLVGEGWFEPEQEDTTFRRSRSRRSWLTVPIREPKNYTLVMRARAEVEGHGFTARLDVNGNPVGEVELVPGWSNYDFDIPECTLRPGLNDLTFVYSTTPRMLIPDFRGKNAVMAVDWLRFTPR